MDLPYRAEYAKSGRASCKACKGSIGKDTLRLAVLIQSPVFDGKVPNWYHYKCFFNKQRPKTTDDIQHFEMLRWGDQELIRKNIVGEGSSCTPSGKKGKKRSSAAVAGQQVKDFKIEYSVSSRAVCRGCEQKIMKEEIRISKKDFETDVGKKYGGQDLWHHLTCFAKLRSEFQFFNCGDTLPGFKTLNNEDQAKVKTELPTIKQEEDLQVKRLKTEDQVDGVDHEIKNQNKTMFKYRDLLKEQLKKAELAQLLKTNKQEIPEGVERILDRLCDNMTFGALEQCTECKTGQLVFRKDGYLCTGHLTEWAKCQTLVKVPGRFPFKVPKELKEKYDFLAKYKCKPCTRVVKDITPTNTLLAAKKDETDSGPKVKRDLPALYKMEFAIAGKPTRGRDQLKKEIIQLGGKVTNKINKNLMAVIGSAADVKKNGAVVSKAQDADVHVVSEDFIDEAKTSSGHIPELIIKKSVCDWGSDPHSRLPKDDEPVNKSKARSIFTSSVPSKIKMKLKGGGAVDPDSGLEDTAHVYENGSDKYTAVLGNTDIQSNKNSFYKIQLLKADKSNHYWVFRSWGRIGTTIGGTKLEKMDSLNDAIYQFCFVYNEKTGNDWKNRSHFEKIPNRMYPIDVDYGQDSVELATSSTVPSKLQEPVQDLMRLIFNINSMKKLMLEFELDTEKMPLGKLSKVQLHNAYSVLSELQQLISSGGSAARFIDATNRFYTFVPHSFGMDNPPLINNLDIIQQKVDMIDNLMELEIAYSLMQKGSDQSGNTLDSNYAQLKADIQALEPDTTEFQYIKDYVKNTHAATHSHYELEVEQVFKLARQGEAQRYKPFRKLHNRKLLWHGSRVTNYAGIISQGLRIAPPDAPVTGYMFGKGIYFADMVSKSANYCCTNQSDSTGLLLLCEVALGEMSEYEHAKYIEKLPKGKHSVKGVGMSHPDPKASKLLPDGVEVPLGKGVPSDAKSTSLLYNEYIVYDIAQVNIKYLLKMNFNYK